MQTLVAGCPAATVAVKDRLCGKHLELTVTQQANVIQDAVDWQISW